MSSSFDSRAREFLNYVVEQHDNRRLTMWGPYRCFDGYALAHLALDRDLDRARELVRETLEMMRQNFLVELARAEDKWHLADFAVHPLLRARLQFHARTIGPAWDAVWSDFEHVLGEFVLHCHDLTENHNLLHHALRYLVGQHWPDLALRDGRRAADHVAEARRDILEWISAWVTQGSVEWGADLYCNVNLLSLLNLVDFARDADVREAARSVVDLMMLDQALGNFAGALVTAARRGYACYRMETPVSPARALQYLHFGPSPESDSRWSALTPTRFPDADTEQRVGVNALHPPPATNDDRHFNVNFIGGVIVGATSTYRVPHAIAELAHDRTPTVSSATHIVPAWDQDHVGQTTFRCRGAMLSAQNCAPGPRAYCADHVWQITLGERAVIFGNAPTAFPPEWQWYREAFTSESVLAGYAGGIRGNLHPLWVPGNMPPGHFGDLRPGYWQGHPQSPRSFAARRAAFVIYRLPPAAPLPWTHVFFPRAEFDEVRATGNWIFARKGEGYAALWTSAPGVWTERGTWVGVELKIPAADTALFALVGDREIDGAFDTFIERACAAAPVWDAARATLAATPPGETERLEVRHDTGASRGGQPIATRSARVATPWGSLPLGELAFRLQAPGGDYAFDLRHLG
ncbi:MAG: hypothetical protein HYV96_04210 [Opitutae bacterium]|nr:hypothetical protein [Opitutae bacterium]